MAFLPGGFCCASILVIPIGGFLLLLILFAIASRLDDRRLDDRRLARQRRDADQHSGGTSAPPES